MKITVLAFSKELFLTDPLHGVVELGSGALNLLEGGVDEGTLLVPVLSLGDGSLGLGHHLPNRGVDGEIRVYQSLLNLEFCSRHLSSSSLGQNYFYLYFQESYFPRS